MYFVSSIWDQNGIRYSGIHQLNGNSDIIPRTGVNLDNYEWCNVMKKAEDINVALYGKQAMKGTKREAPENEIQMFSWSWLLNGNEVKDVPYKMDFFTEVEARRDAEAHRSSKKLSKTDKLELQINSEYKPRPLETTQMKTVLVQIVQGGIDTCKAIDCEACQLDPPAPGQQAHMKVGGCMDPDVDFEDRYIDAVLEVLDVADLLAIYNTTCRWLGISPQGSPLLAKAALRWIPGDVIVTVINQLKEVQEYEEDHDADPVVYYQNTALRKIVREVYSGLGMRDIMGKKLKN